MAPSLPCRWHTPAVPLPLPRHCHAATMSLTWCCHVADMALPRRCSSRWSRTKQGPCVRTSKRDRSSACFWQDDVISLQFNAIC